MPFDWAHRHGDLWGRGVPGLCTCLIAFINHASAKRVIADWNDVIREVASMSPTDPKLAEWNRLMGHTGEIQLRDQELLSISLRNHDYPDVKLFPLTFEWVCPNTRRPSALWVEGTVSRPDRPFSRLTSNPCKSLHSHFLPIYEWLQDNISRG